MVRSTHPALVAIERIARLDLPVQQKQLLNCLVYHADWDTLGSSYPNMRTLREWTGLGQRQVQRHLQQLTCASPRPRRLQLSLGREQTVYEPCGRCQVVNDRGVLVPGADLLLATTRPDGTVAYTLVLERVEQMRLPDVPPARVDDEDEQQPGRWASGM